MDRHKSTLKSRFLALRDKALAEAARADKARDASTAEYFLWLAQRQEDRARGC